MLFVQLCLFIHFNFFVVIGYTQISLNKNALFEVSPTILFKLKSISDMQVFHWQSSYFRKFYHLQLNGTVNQAGSGFLSQCSDVNASIIVRVNGIPVPTHNNLQIPKNVIIQNHGVLHSGSFLISATQSNHPSELILRLNKSEHLHFFISMFLPTDLQDTKFKGITKPCRYYGSLKLFATNISEEFAASNKSKNISKTLLPKSTFRKQKHLFNVNFFPANFVLNLTSNNSESVFWNVLPLADSGGTLFIKLKSKVPSDFDLTDSNNISVVGCLKNPILANVDRACNGSELLLYNLIESTEATWNVPFPLSGLWELQLHLKCVNNFFSDIILPVELSVTIKMCIDNCMKELNRGRCGLYRTDQVLLATCKCKVGWSGLSCRDGKNAITYNRQILHVLLLTFSNIGYIPGMILAARRSFYTESFVYFCVMIASTFYHACDQPGETKFCVLSYETLQFSDFYFSSSAIWITLITVARLSSYLESFLKVSGIVIISIFVKHNRFSLFSLTLPVVIGGLVLGFSWKQKSTKNNCYPGKEKLLFSVLPSFLLAFISIMLNAFVENEKNYFIVHSIWHISTGLTIAFVISLEEKETNNTIPIKKDDSNPKLTFNDTQVLTDNQDM